MKNTAHIKDQALRYVRVARKNAPLIFVVFLIAVYGFLAWRITSLLQTEPDPNAVSAQLQSVDVKVDATALKKMEQLKDNNVSVQTLFDNARSNPFQE